MWAKALARRGELEEGERLAREAVVLAAETDMLNAHAEALVDLAEILSLAGRDARSELDRALALYEQKGNLVMAERTRAGLAQLAASGALARGLVEASRTCSSPRRSCASCRR